MLVLQNISGDSASDWTDAEPASDPNLPEPEVDSSDDFENSDSPDSALDEDDDEAAKKLASAFVITQAQTYSKHTVAKSFYNTAFKQRFRIKKLVQNRRSWKSYKAARTRLTKFIPKIRIEHYFLSKENGQEKLVVGTKLPEKQFLRDNKYDLVHTWSRISIADALTVQSKIHCKTKENHAYRWKNAGLPPLKIVLSMDGVPIDNSSGLTLEVVSFKLVDCDTIYPIGIHIGISKEKNLDRIFGPIIQELADLNAQVATVLADSPQRTALLNMDAVTAYFGCAKCYARGEPNTEKREKGDKKGASVLWPTETIWQAPRTMESWIRDIEASATNKQHGIKGDTPLRKLVSCLIAQVPIDVFHVVYLGLAKRIIKQVLRIKDQGATGIMKEVKAKVDKDIRDVNCVQYPSDFSRRPRPISVPMYKSSEWRSLVTAGFPLLTFAFDEFRQPAANKLWGYFIFLVKAFLLPNELYEDLKTVCNLKLIMTNFYKIYVRVCKKRSCAPNLHMFHHLLEARNTMEFSDMSTEVFESAYAILKKSYQVGTKSQGKQMLERLYTLLLANADKHSCRRKMRIRPKTKGKYNDSLIVAKDHRFYRVEGKLANGNYAAKRLVLGNYTYPHAASLPFHKLWTHKVLGELPALKEISPDIILGKASICKNIITLLPHGAIFG